MAKDKWVIEETRAGYSFYIGWFCADEGDVGAHFGDGKRDDNGKIHYDANDPWEIAHNMACDEVAQLKLGQLHDGQWVFDTMADAKAGLKLLNSALKRAKDGKPWPEWALKAQAAGWKPPKGWKP